MVQVKISLDRDEICCGQDVAYSGLDVVKRGCNEAYIVDEMQLRVDGLKPSVGEMQAQHYVAQRG